MCRKKKVSPVASSDDTILPQQHPPFGTELQEIVKAPEFSIG
jgi:hypothetical protein